MNLDQIFYMGIRIMYNVQKYHFFLFCFEQNLFCNIMVQYYFDHWIPYIKYRESIALPFAIVDPFQKQSYLSDKPVCKAIDFNSTSP